MWFPQLIRSVLFFFPFVECHAGLILINTCGETVCGPHQYCSSFDQHCRSCSDVCDANSQNLDHKRCESQCQNYLHDILYQRINQSSQSFELASTILKLQEEVGKLSLYTHATFIFTGMILVIMIAALIRWIIRNAKKRRKINFFHSKAAKSSTTIATSLPELVTTKETSFGMPSKLYTSRMHHQRINQVFYPSSLIRPKRSPTEQACPEGIGYDNPAMSSISHIG